jgi:hypothetical protein
MSLALVSSSLAILTKTENGNSFTCDLDGNPCDPGLLIAKDAFTGKYFARVAEVIPSDNTPTAKAQKEAILALNPIHFISDDGTIKGYFVPAPDFNNRDSSPKAPIPTPAL